MKKIFVILLAAIYITSSIGVVINMHYCMGEAIGWGLGKSSSDICGNCGMKENDPLKEDGCCRDAHTFIKNNGDQKISDTGFFNIQSTVILNTPLTETPTAIFCTTSSKKYISHSSPRINNVAIYLRNCAFLI